MPNLRDEQKLLVASILGAAAFWIVDAAIDAFVFRDYGFWVSLRGDLSVHELYFRLLFLAGFVLFGFVSSQFLKKRREAEEGLRRALVAYEDERTKSASVLEAIPDGISIQGREFRVLYQNEVHKRLAGEHQGEYCYEAYARRNAVCPGCPVDQAFKDGKNHVLEKSRTDGNGAVHIEINASPLRNAKGEIIAGIEAVRNITERKRAEDAVRESSERLRTLLETIPDAVYFKDNAGRHVIVNQATEKMIGRSRDEIIGKAAEELFPPDAAANCRASDESALRGRMPYFCEEKITSPGGETIYIETVKAPLFDERGAAVGITGISRDITERKRAEDALKESEEKYKNLVELTTDIIYRSDRNGNQVYMNDAAFKALEYSPEEVIGKPVINLIHPDDRQRTWDKRREMIERGIDVFNFENRYVARTGKAINVLHNVRVLRNEQGEIVGTQGIARDITERKRAEEKLRLFSEAIEEAMDGVQIVDLNGRIMYSNKAVKEIYGFSDDELRGKHVNEMNVDPAFAEQVILPSLRETGRWNGELMVRHKDGREFPIWLSASTVRNDKGEPIAMVGIIRDITERKRTEHELRAHRERLEDLVQERTQDLLVANEQLQREFAARRRMEEDLIRAQKLESLSLLAGGIAHDFNNLLASIMGNISLAMLDLPAEEQTCQQLASAERAALRARELTLQLLTFSRGGAPVKTYASLEQLVRDTADFSLRGAKARLAFSFPGGLWPVEVDQGQMAQVVNNLIINADQAMPEGGVIMITGENVALGPEDALPLKEGNYVRIAVKDQGIGIPKEYLSKIFDPYFTTKQKGSGLGLAITYSIIQKHEGFISVASEVGVGTTFRILLPASPERRTLPRPREEKLFPGRGRILVMDDEADVRKTTGDILTRLGYTVAFAEDGAQAIDIYRRAREAGDPFDLAIMDLTVPGGMGGKDALKKLLEVDPAAKAIVSSGYSKDPVMAEFADYGFKGVVEKPFRVKELSETVHRVLNDRS